MNALKLGRVVATPAAIALLNHADVLPYDLLARHARGDWGIVCAEDARSNDDAVKYGERVLSAYEVGGDKVWVITERDRSVTTILLPDDY